jgi:predicted DCC family thiol-disulfide oxidoreductase YuxK
MQERRGKCYYARVEEPQKNILTFDGTCGLCDRAVTFVMKRDKNERFLFTAAGSNTAHTLAREADMPVNLSDTTVVLFSGKKHYEKSTAVMEICRLLGFPWSLMTAGYLLPKFLRDAVYDFVARHRYQVFGRVNTCSMETEENAGRFLA